MARYHINDNGDVNPCSAKFKCDFDLTAEEHYHNKASATKAAELQTKAKYATIPAPQSSSSSSNVANSNNVMELSHPLGSVSVTNGDLSSREAREAFTTGLCGDLALAIHDIIGSPLYFICDSSVSQEELNSSFADDPHCMTEIAMHVVTGSRKKGHFLDAHGQTSKESIIQFYSEIGEQVHILKGTREQAIEFSIEKDASKYSQFALTAINMDQSDFSHLREVREF